MKDCLAIKPGSMLVPALALLLFCMGSPARGNELRTSTLGRCGIALYDSDNQLNPYDFGRNPAYLLYDFEEPWIRFIFGLEEESGELKRPYDPLLVNNLYMEYRGIKKLSDRHVVTGNFRYSRLWQREIPFSIELDQYNDPFYLTDPTTGDFEYYGPSIKVDYALRLTPRLSLGAGFDYDISTGLKQEYTRPEIVHNYFRGNLGLIYRARESWLVGLTARPIRLLNRTKFAKTDEGYDNIIYRRYGDGIYDIRSFGTYSIEELLWGVELGVQNFIMTESFKLGAIFSYGFNQNKIRYGKTRRRLRGFWQDTSYDMRLLARYTPEGIPMIIGLSGRLLDEEGWAKRPDYDDVLLYENPMKLLSLGAGFSYLIRPLNLLASMEYIMNRYDIEVDDYGASLARTADIVQNVGRLGIEYSVFNIYSLRGGIEVTDYPVDRWIKLPRNMDRYRFTGGVRYNIRLWEIDVQLAYRRDTKEDLDTSRRGLSGIVWFTRIFR